MGFPAQREQGTEYMLTPDYAHGPIRTATIIPATVMKMNAESGSVETGEKEGILFWLTEIR